MQGAGSRKPPSPVSSSPALIRGSDGTVSSPHSTQHPIDFPDWCEAHYDSQTCQISVVQKANPSLPCVKSVEHEWGSAGTPEPLVNKVLGAGLSR